MSSALVKNENCSKKEQGKVKLLRQYEVVNFNFLCDW